MYVRAGRPAFARPCVGIHKCNFRGLVNAKNMLVGEQRRWYLIDSWSEKGVHTFPKSISLKRNVIARLDFELSYYGTTV